MLTEYQKFIESKRHSVEDFGIEPISIPDTLFDYQKHVAAYLIKKGRAACFLDTGLGKTLIELCVADNYEKKTQKPVLIMTPLAVAFQFEKEAEKFGVSDVGYSKDGKIRNRITICNYERIHLFNASDFDCVICDESSILKNFKGATKNLVTSFLKKIKYRFLFTATPSPNDFVELGTSSEALGYLGYTDMLTKFFTNNEDTISPMGIGVEWRLKGHSKDAFFRWVKSWSISMRKPSDAGFDDTMYVLPKLILNDYSVENKVPLCVNGQYQMFNIVAKTRSEIAAENKMTITARCEKAVGLASDHETSVYWCNLNPEADMLRKIDKNTTEISGNMKLEAKEEILLDFLNGKIKKLITKPKMTAFGLNWQHCNHTVFFPGFSYEQYYQSIRRFHRFGQTKDVHVDRVFSDGQTRIIEALEAKSEKANTLFNELNKYTNQSFEIPKIQFTQQVQLPSFLK